LVILLRTVNGVGNDFKMCAVIDANNEDHIIFALKKAFPRIRDVKIEWRHPHFIPDDNFVGFENRTLLYVDPPNNDIKKDNEDIIKKRLESV